MKTTDINIEKLENEFNVQNTLIYKNTPLLQAAQPNLDKLEAEGNTVIVTDMYLFDDGGDSSYISVLNTLLGGLKANKIIYCAVEKPCKRNYNQVKTFLDGKNTDLDWRKELGPCHDRFWYCPETEKCVIFGTSLNGIGSKIFRIDMLDEDEVKTLKTFLVDAGIIGE